MNHDLWTRVGARVAALAFVIAGAAACGEKISDVSSGGPTAAPASPSAQVIGVAPAPPSGDPPGTSPVSGNTSDVTKQEESAKKPQEGDNHSHSSVAQDNPQKAQGKDPLQTPERKSDGK